MRGRRYGGGGGFPSGGGGGGGGFPHSGAPPMKTAAPPSAPAPAAPEVTMDAATYYQQVCVCGASVPSLPALSRKRPSVVVGEAVAAAPRERHQEDGQWCGGRWVVVVCQKPSRAGPGAWACCWWLLGCVSAQAERVPDPPTRVLTHTHARTHTPTGEEGARARPVQGIFCQY